MLCRQGNSSLTGDCCLQRSFVGGVAWKHNKKLMLSSIEYSWTYSCHNNVIYLFKTLVSCKLHIQYPAQNDIIERQLSVNLTLSNCCMFCRRNLWALYQGKNTSLIISLTPFSWNLSVSPLTTGELIRYNLPKIKTKNVPYRVCIIKLRRLTKFYYL